MRFHHPRHPFFKANVEENLILVFHHLAASMVVQMRVDRMTGETPKGREFRKRR
jgi:hypothetical protein